MGWCHEFGCQITSGCNHPMKAGSASCTCSVCETVCKGRFSGCPEVFARSLVTVGRAAASAQAPPPMPPAQPTVAQPIAAQASPPAFARAPLGQIVATAVGAAGPHGEGGGSPRLQASSGPGGQGPQPPPRPATGGRPAGGGPAPAADRPSRPTGPEPGRSMAPAAGASPAPAAPGGGQEGGSFLSRENGSRILHWMRAEFDGVRSQLHAMASSLAHQQALVADLTNSRGGELNDALAELEGTATQLRTEASRMRRDAGGLQEDGAELRRESTRLRELEREMTERLPQVVAEAVQPELRAALREVEAITAGLREEASQLRSIRDGLTEQLPRVVDAAVREALANFVPAPAPAAAPAAPQGAQSAPEANGFGVEALAESVAATSALADEPVEDLLAPAAFGPPPAADPMGAVAAGGVGEDPLVCALPGLVVGPSLALAVSEALRRASLRRRRRRRAAKPTPGLHRRDPFASPVTRRLDRYARARADLATVKTTSATRPSAVAAGYRDGEEVTVDLAECPGLRLVGPAAPDVARFVATSFLAQAAAAAGGDALVVGDLLPPGQAFPGLRQPADLATALAELSSDGRTGTTLLVAREPSVAERAALAELLRPATTDGPPPVLAVLVGDPPPDDAPSPDDAPGPDDAPVPDDRGQADGNGAPWATVRLSPGERVAEVDAGAVAAPLVGARLYSLGREAATELIAVLASARTDEEVIAPTAGDGEPFEVVTPDAPSVAVQLLGTYRIDVGGVEIRAGLRAKARELLAFYLLHPAGTTLDAAVEALWPEADPGRGSEWFWTALGNLRSRLRDATGDKKLKVIEREGDRYRVEPLFDVDLWRLEQALSDGANGGDDFVRAEAYDRVAQTYTGDLLAGADWAWAETPREDVRQRVLDVLVWLGDVRWASGDARGSWQALQRAVEVDPYAEQIYRRIMRLQAKLGRPDDAGATFRRLQARLVEIDLEPTPESEKLFAELSGSAAGG